MQAIEASTHYITQKNLMAIRILAVTCLLVSLAVHIAASASPQPFELGPLQMTPPDGWVRNPSRTSVSWLPAGDPSGNSCIIVMTEAELSDKPQEAFAGLWNRATRGYRDFRPSPPEPNVVQMPAGFKMGRGSYVGPLNQQPRLYFAVANVTDGDAGLAFVSAGTDVQNCHESFRKFLQSLVPVGGAATQAASGSRPLYDAAGNIRQDQRLADQRAQDRQAQDRLFQQREMERQAQNRLAQQRLADSQAQQRIQDSYRRK